MRVLVMMAVLALSGPLMAMAVQPPDDRDILLVVLPPWQDGDAVLDAVDGVVIGPVQAPFAMLVQSAHPRVEVAAYDAGAWWGGSAGVLAAICGVRP